MSSSTTSFDVQALYSEHYGWLRNWLRYKLGSATDAPDIAQDTFLRLLVRHQRQPLTIDRPRAYLSTVAHGLVIDHWRRRDLEQAWLETLAALPESETPSPETRAIVLEALLEIDRLLDELKPAVRAAFLLAQLEGLTSPQIAERLGISLATAERHIAQALRCCYAARQER